MATSNFDINVPLWRQSPNSRETFRDITKVLQTVPIKAGHASSPLGENKIPTDGIQISWKEAALDWETFLDKTGTDSLVILHKGQIVVEQYRHQNEASSRHIIFSITKSVTGLLVGILHSQGKIDPDALVTKYIPEMAKVKPFATCTLRHLLDMRSGTTVDDKFGQYSIATGFRPSEGDRPTVHEFMLSLGDAPHGTPGEGPFEYFSINTDLLGWCIERATGEKLADLISELIWQPMGAEYDATITVDKAGNARAAGGMSASVRDLARVGYLVARKGAGIVPEAWIDDMVHDGDLQAFSKGAFAPAFSAATGYRSCWICDREKNTATALGIHGQVLFVDLQNDMVLARLSSKPDAVDFNALPLTMQALEQVQTLISR